jgi:hypothetical protein
MTAADLIVTLVGLGAFFTPLESGALKLTAPQGTLTPALRQAFKCHKPEIMALLATWDETLADRLLQAVLRRVAAGYRPTWRRRFYDDAPRWLVVEGMIEAAAMMRDMAAFIRALVEYQAFALQTFTIWAQQEEARR